MKVLIQTIDTGGNSVTKTGWYNALMHSGFDVRLWNNARQPAFDIFNEFEPDVFIGTTYDLNRAVYKNIVKRPNMKVAMWASDYGPMMEKMDLEKFPVLVAREDEIDLVGKLKKETGKPDVVFCHYPQSRLDETHGYWKRLGVDYISMMNAWDALVYQSCAADLSLEADISFVGGIWKYKRRTLFPYIFPLLFPIGDYHIKIYGQTHWNVPQYCGIAGSAQEKHIFASSQICPSISEPHSQVYGWDLIERPFKVMGNGQSLCISDYVEGFREFFNVGELPMANTPETFKDTIDYYLRKENLEEKDAIILAAQKAVLRDHSYHHRVIDLLSSIGMHKESTKVLEAYLKLLNERGQLHLLED